MLPKILRKITLLFAVGLFSVSIQSANADKAQLTIDNQTENYYMRVDNINTTSWILTNLKFNGPPKEDVLKNLEPKKSSTIGWQNMVPTEVKISVLNKKGEALGDKIITCGNPDDKREGTYNSYVTLSDGKSIHFITDLKNYKERTNFWLIFTSYTYDNVITIKD